MRHILFSFASIVATLSIASPVLASPYPGDIGPGDLIKASGSSVYYVANDAKRYVFPTDKTYFSWYGDFLSVKTISDSGLASYPLGGNVTYRPGIKLIKITTDPKVYAVGRYGTLRWVETEQVAAALYGTDWAKKVDDIPDAFFVNYSIGASIKSTNDFSPSQEQIITVSIQANLPTPLPVPVITPPPSTTGTAQTPPPPTTTYTGSVTPSNATPRAGDTITLTASANPSASISQLKIFFNSSLQRTCEYVPCAIDVLIPVSNTKPSYEMAVDVTWIDNHHIYTTSSLEVGAGGSGGILISVSRPEVKPNATREIILEATQSFIAKYLDIFIDGGNIKGCTNVQICRYATQETSPTGTVHTIYGIATDANGFTQKSNTETFRVVDNDHPYLTMIVGKTTMYPGETVDVSVSATDDDGINWTEVWLDGAKLKHCDSVVCVVTAGPWSNPRTVNFVGKAADTTGLENAATSTTITINPR